MSTKRALAVSAAFFSVACVGFERDALAQRAGFAIDRFEPSERGSGWFVADTLDLRGHLRPAIGAVADYGYKPLVVYDRAGNEVSAIVRHQLFAHVGGSVVLWDRLRLGVNLPIALYQDGETGQTLVNGTAETFRPANQASIGDVRLSADVRVVGETTDPFTLALGVRGWAPTGDRNQFTGDGTFRVAPQALAAGEIGAFTYAARLGMIYRSLDTGYAGSDLGSELTGSAAAGLRVVDRRLVIGPEIWGSSVFSGSDTFFSKRSSPVEWLFGAHFDATKELRVGAGGGSGLTRGFGAPEVRGVLSVEWVAAYEKPRGDRDGDGIADDEDACPSLAGVRTDDPSTNGCPPEAPAAPKDQDGDGVVDSEDACPSLAGRKTDDPKTNGCPDSDQDGIFDPVDACPAIAGVATQDPKTNGCPDSDHDGIVDSEDACPSLTGVKTDDPKTNGCPPDQDHDGIVDGEDACPADPGPRNPDPKKNGCPLVYATAKEIKITEQIKFKTNSAEILKESDEILTAIAKVLNDHPEIKKVRVEGHTDNVGKPAYNKTLSTKRAASVVKWLTSHGVRKDRLVSQGYGMDQPIDTNDTEEGRANNRRVNFVIVQKTE